MASTDILVDPQYLRVVRDPNGGPDTLYVQVDALTTLFDKRYAPLQAAAIPPAVTATTVVVTQPASSNAAVATSVPPNLLAGLKLPLLISDAVQVAVSEPVTAAAGDQFQLVATLDQDPTGGGVVAKLVAGNGKDASNYVKLSKGTNTTTLTAQVAGGLTFLLAGNSGTAPLSAATLAKLPA